MPRSPEPPRPPSTGLRRTIERRSGPMLVVLSRQPKLLIPVVSLALLIAGLVLGGALGAVLLAVLIALIGWLTYLSWPVVPPPGRAIRVATLAMLVLLATSRL